MSTEDAVLSAAHRRGWRTVPVWSIATRVDRTGFEDAELLSVYRDWGVVRKADRDDNFNVESDDLSSYKYVRPGDLVLNKMKTWQGSLAVSEYEGIVSPAYYVCKLSSLVNSRYLHYLLRSDPYIAMYGSASKGIRPNQWDLPFDAFRRLPVLLPPLEEQRRIADFLDDQITRLEGLMSARRDQTLNFDKLLESALSAAFNEHSCSFGSARLAVGLRSIRQGWSPQCEDRLPEPDEWGVLRAGCVNGGTFRPNDVKALPTELEPRAEFLVRAGDLLINRASGSLDLIGSCAIVSDDVRPRTLLCDKVYKLALSSTWLPEYVEAMWASRQVRESLRLHVSGAEGMANSLPSSVVVSTRLPAAPVEVQRAWLVEWRKQAAETNKLQSQLRAAQGLLDEYKRSLITAAVTGELDVSTAGSGVPA